MLKSSWVAYVYSLKCVIADDLLQFFSKKMILIFGSMGTYKISL